jgi:hypothetical protein
VPGRRLFEGEGVEHQNAHTQARKSCPICWPYLAEIAAVESRTLDSIIGRVYQEIAAIGHAVAVEGVTDVIHLAVDVPPQIT